MYTRIEKKKKKRIFFIPVELVQRKANDMKTLTHENVISMQLSKRMRLKIK